VLGGGGGVCNRVSAFWVGFVMRALFMGLPGVGWMCSGLDRMAGADGWVYIGQATLLGALCVNSSLFRHFV
jgi:hypothetical protein